MNPQTQEAYLLHKGQGRREIYLVTIEGLDFLFRPLVYSEHLSSLDLEKALPAHDVNEWLCRKVILYPDNKVVSLFFDNCKPGHIDIFADQIIKVSGFSHEETFIKTLQEKRSDFMKKIDNLLMAQICAAMPSITPDMIKEKTFDEMLDLVVLAESILGNQLDLERIMAGDEAPAKPQFPVPPGMESTEFAPMPLADILGEHAADKPPSVGAYG